MTYNSDSDSVASKNQPLEMTITDLVMLVN